MLKIKFHLTLLLVVAFMGLSFTEDQDKDELSTTEVATIDTNSTALNEEVPSENNQVAPTKNPQDQILEENDVRKIESSPFYNWMIVIFMVSFLVLIVVVLKKSRK